MKHLVAIIGVASVFAMKVQPESRETESYHVRRLAPQYKAKTEVVLWDRTRVDMLTSEYAIEVDYAPNWAEAIGQSLYYAKQTGKRPGVILLNMGPPDHRFVYRAKIAGGDSVKVWVEEI